MRNLVRKEVIVAALITGICTIIAAIIALVVRVNPSEPKTAVSRTYTIAGTIMDNDTYEGVSHAEISIVGRTESCISEDNGNFSFEIHQVKPNPIRLRVKKKNYKPSEQTVIPPTEQMQVLLKK